MSSIFFIQQPRIISVKVYEIVNHNTDSHHNRAENVIKDYGYSLKKYTYNILTKSAGVRVTPLAPTTSDSCVEATSDDTDIEEYDIDYDYDGCQTDTDYSTSETLTNYNNDCCNGNEMIGQLCIALHTSFSTDEDEYTPVEEYTSTDCIYDDDDDGTSGTGSHRSSFTEEDTVDSSVICKITRKFKHTRIYHKPNNVGQQLNGMFKKQNTLCGGIQDDKHQKKEKQKEEEEEDVEEYEYTEVWHTSSSSSESNSDLRDGDDEEIIEEDIYEEGFYNNHTGRDSYACQYGEFDVCEEDDSAEEFTRNEKEILK
uniref:Uncharacterized protein n=1 Tax=Trichobilharzia regenti TaxID=157069 RepID=A0AA85JY50_TRIRE|nr:unnamed protein product [Trichobilharzia regenti]